MNNPQPGKPAAVAEAAQPKETASDFERLLMQDIKTELRYKPFGAEDEISLSVPRIRRFVAVPYVRDGKTYEPSDQECIKFLLLCRARKLNVWEGDAYMIPFLDRQSNGPRWSLITAHNAFIKRAEISKEYDGMESGVIVQDADKAIQYREGDFTFPGDTLLGGWAVVHVRGRTHQTKSRMKLQTYQKSFGNWVSDPAGMIVKVAEADALRRTFPTMIGGLYLESEMEIEPTPRASTAKKPADFAGPGGGKAFTDAPPRTTAPVSDPNAGKTPQDEPGEGETQTANALGAASQGANGAQSTPEKEKVQTSPPVSDKKGPEPTEKPPIGRANRPTMVEKEPEERPEATEKALFVPNPNENEQLQNVRFLCHEYNVTEEQLVRWCKSPEAKLLKEGQQHIADLSSMKLANLGKLWGNSPKEFLAKIQAVNAAAQ